MDEVLERPEVKPSKATGEGLRPLRQKTEFGTLREVILGSTEEAAFPPKRKTIANFNDHVADLGPTFYDNYKEGERITFADAKPGRVEAYVESGSITVKGYDGKDVIITTSIGGKKSTEQEQEEIPEKAKGMKRIAANRTGLVVEEENNEMKIYVTARDDEVNLDIQVPIRTSL